MPKPGPVLRLPIAEVSLVATIRIMAPQRQRAKIDLASHILAVRRPALVRRVDGLQLPRHPAGGLQSVLAQGHVVELAVVALQLERIADALRTGVEEVLRGFGVGAEDGDGLVGDLDAEVGVGAHCGRRRDGRVEVVGVSGCLAFVSVDVCEYNGVEARNRSKGRSTLVVVVIVRVSTPPETVFVIVEVAV